MKKYIEISISDNFIYATEQYGKRYRVGKIEENEEQSLRNVINDFIDDIYSGDNESDELFNSYNGRLICLLSNTELYQEGKIYNSDFGIVIDENGLPSAFTINNDDFLDNKVTFKIMNDNKMVKFLKIIE